ncbi:MAG: DUF4405 domain-containing protein [Erysipelotrichaceae bacterium]|nr:DUF4405 domain-containing protein [Erysipelotrichaceae bacterium]
MNKTRQIIDIMMIVLMPLLMAYSLIGETFHEVAGTLLFVLLVCHNILNRKWWLNIFKGRYNLQRFFRTVINVALIVIMVLQIATGIILSRHLFTFIDLTSLSSKAREIHLCLGSWGLITMSIHAGMHMSPLIKRFHHQSVVYVILTLISLYGIYALIKRHLLSYMFLTIAFAFFDYNEPLIYFIFDILTVMVLMASTGMLMSEELKKL